MKKLKNKNILFTFILAVLLVAITWAAWPTKGSVGNNAQSQPASSNTKASSPEFDKTQNPTDVALSLWVVVNKGRVLPSSYTPNDLVVPKIALRLSANSPEMHVRADTATALESMTVAASKDGVTLMLASGYRSYSEQQTVYQNYVNTQGQAAADTFSARPGHSEHQTGLAADLEPTSRQCEVEQCFENTPEGKWLAARATSYGFIIRYQKTTQKLTGYEYEPWHVRYVGLALAAEISKTGQTLEQFFGLPNYTDYPAQSLQLKM